MHETWPSNLDMHQKNGIQELDTVVGLSSCSQLHGATNVSEQLSSSKQRSAALQKLKYHVIPETENYLQAGSCSAPIFVAEESQERSP
jgi:hypothetical protein